MSETLSCQRLWGRVSYNHAFRDHSVRADKFQLSKCNARIYTGFCVGGGGGGHVWEGGGKDGR